MRVSVNTVLAFCIRSYIKHCRTFSFMLCQLETNHYLSPEGRGEGRILVISSQACISTVILSTTPHLSFGEALKKTEEIFYWSISHQLGEQAHRPLVKGFIVLMSTL